jgi:hypothetical protein
MARELWVVEYRRPNDDTWRVYRAHVFEAERYASRAMMRMQARSDVIGRVVRYVPREDPKP